MKTKPGMTIALAALAALFLSACGDGGGSGPSNSEPALSSDAGSSGDGSSVGGSSDDDDGYSSDENGSDGGRSSRKKSSSSSSSTSSSSADEGPQSPLGACAASNDGEIKQDVDALVGEAGVRYLCDAGLGAWREATVLEYDTYLWDPADDGFVQKGQVTDAIYKYDSLQGAWRKANANDTAFGLGGCTQKREGKVGLAATDYYYICRNGKWGGAKAREYNTYGLQCDGNSALVHGLVVDSLLYVCDADTFRDATVSEKLADLGCTSYNAGDSVLFKGYARCAGGGRWIAARTTVPDTLIDPRDGHAYKTVGIGLQRWMAENLDYEYKVDGSTYGNWCYNDSAEYCARYGRLYTYGAAMDTATTKCGSGKVCAAASGYNVQGVCPAGWHLPAKEEFTLLFNAVGDSATAGSALKSADMSGEDAYGFSALAGGQRGYRVGFVEAGAFAYFWTKNGYGRDEAYAELMRSDYANVPALRNSKSSGHSVRCVED